MRTSIFRAVMAVLVLALASIALPAHAVPTDLTASATNASGQVTIIGTVTSASAPVANAPLQVILNDSQEIASGTTGADGTFTITTDVSALPVGDHKLVVRFPGQGSADAKDWAAVLRITTAPTSTSTLTIAGPDSVGNGQLIQLTGVLSDETGAGIKDGGISVTLNGTEVKDSYVVTGENGSYSTFVEVPENQAEGTVKVGVSFAGTPANGSASAELEVAVHHIDTLPSDGITSWTPSTSPSESVPPSSESPNPSPSASDTPTEAKQGGSSLPLITFGAIGAGVLALGAAFAFYLRNRRHAQPARGADEEDAEATSSWLIGKAGDEATSTETQVLRPADIENTTVLGDRAAGAPASTSDDIFRPTAAVPLDATTPLPAIDRPEPPRPSRAAPEPSNEPSPAPGRAAPAEGPQHGALERDDFDPPPSSKPRRGI